MKMVCLLIWIGISVPVDSALLTDYVGKIADRAAYRSTRMIVENERPVADTVFIVNNREATTFLFGIDTGKKQLVYADTTGVEIKPHARYFPDYPNISAVPIPPHAALRLDILSQDHARETYRLLSKQEVLEYIYQDRRRIGAQMLINTLSLGFLSLIFLFFLFYALVANQRLYTLYSGYLLFALLFCITMPNELPMQAKSWLNQLAHLTSKLNETLVAWMFVWYIAFCDELLTISKQNRVLREILKVTKGLLILYGCFQLYVAVWGLNAEHLQAIYRYFRFFFIPVYVLILVLVIVWIKSPLKVFVLIGNAFLLAGTIVSVVLHFSTVYWQVGSSRILHATFLQIGIVGETICFSLALGYYNQLIRKQRDEKIREQKEIEQKMQKLTLQSIEAQMNPHFLFNGINAVRDLVIKNKNEAAMNYLNALALLLRNSLINSRKESITLSDELTAVAHYLTIERLRLGHGFTYGVRVDKDIQPEEVEIPPQLLHPSVENAVKHGLRHSKKDKKRIDIVVEPDGPDCRICVIDNGVGMGQSKQIREKEPLKSTQLGLQLTRDKIAIFNKQNATKIDMTIQDVLNDLGEVVGTAVCFLYKRADFNP